MEGKPQKREGLLYISIGQPCSRRKQRSKTGQCLYCVQEQSEMLMRRGWRFEKPGKICQRRKHPKESLRTGRSGPSEECDGGKKIKPGRANCVQRPRDKSNVFSIAGTWGKLASGG